MNKWYEQAIFYHMYPFGMVGAAKRNDGEEIQHHFKDLEKWIPHLEAIEISALYIGPLFESTSHGYDTKDYYQVDRRLGTNEEFKHFVQICHQHHIKVVVDGVFNHTGKEFFAFLDIMQHRENSMYRDWYKDVDFSRTAPSGEPFYFGAWRNIYDLANLNLYNPEVRNYLLDVIRFWIKEFDIDGIRLDCADCLTFEFMSEMRSVCDQEKADFWLMGELIHGDYSRWINESMLHSSTNYELHKGLYSGHNDHNYFEIAHSIKRQFDDNGGIYKGMKLYTFVDNHDVDRIASKLNNKEHLPLVHILLYTLPGIPSIYYGSEWGIEGRKEGGNDDPLRPKLDIDEMIQNNPNPQLTALIAKLGKLKKEHHALTYGKYKELLLTNRQYAFTRSSEEDTILIALNNDDDPAALTIPCPCDKQKAISLLDDTTYAIENGTLSITLDKNTGNIFQLK
ncbi:MAG: alpha-amylase [Erysipelotrichia bacterium]|nr:alpha-amylase [Erysipelotrichia bacterium]NCC55278.1 alpha-amylase [Erysipelotrichia bacterium]